MPVERVHAALQREMFALLADSYEGVTVERFERDLSEKSKVILLYDEGRRLRGFSTVQIADRSIDGRRVIVVFSGDTVVDRAYWGAKELQVQFSRVLARAKLRRPGHRMYWLLTSKGIRTYLLLTNYFSRAYPRFDVKTPDDEAALIDILGRQLSPDTYDAASGILPAPAGGQRVSPGVSDVRPQDRDQPHVRYFLKRNPGWAEGDELVCVARVGMFDLWRAWGRSILKRIQARRPKA